MSDSYRKRGGYESGGEPIAVTDLPPVPGGPAPGARGMRLTHRLDQGWADPAGIGAPATVSPAVEAFAAALAEQPAPRVLELGTMRWEPDRASHHRVWAPHASAYVMSDIAAGPDVDVIADAHDLIVFGDGEFDAVIAVSLWEHLDRPWIAAAAVARVMAPGAVAYIGTHQSFPIHGYPQDAWRFTRESLALIFADAGLVDIVTGYQYPCKITPPQEVTRWNPAAEAYLNVDLFAAKPFWE